MPAITNSKRLPTTAEPLHLQIHHRVAVSSVPNDLAHQLFQDLGAHLLLYGLVEGTTAIGRDLTGALQKLDL